MMSYTIIFIRTTNSKSID